MSREEAIKLAESGWWEHATPRQIAEFQLSERLLCMPFNKFHEAVEKALGRPVWTHEFGTAGAAGIKAELMGEKPAPTMAEIIELIPPEKRIVVVT